MSERDGGNSCGNTVFIHKLYDLLENTELDDLIWWDEGGESFLIRPNESFSRNLALYFKHTNITSFVRQLNIYGFHKISNDHFQQSDKEKGKKKGVKVWEFKHSNGLFRRGDLESLRLIKRRSTSKSAVPSALAEQQLAGSMALSAEKQAKNRKKKKKKKDKDRDKEKEKENDNDNDNCNEAKNKKHATKNQSTLHHGKSNIKEEDEETVEVLHEAESNNIHNTKANANILNHAIPYSMHFDNSVQLNQIKYTNLDMLSIIELISKMTRLNKEILTMDYGPKLSGAIARQLRMFEVQITALKNGIVDRLNSDAFMEGPNANNSDRATGDNVNTNASVGTIVPPSSGLPVAQPGTSQYQNAMLFAHHQDQPLSNKNVPFYPKHHGSNSSPLSSTASSSFSKNLQGPGTVGDYFGNVQHVAISNNPFEKLQSERHGAVSVSSRRNMSVLMDPLTPASMISVPTTSKSALRNSSAYSQLSMLMYQQHQDPANGYFSRNEPTMTPLSSSHGYNTGIYPDPNVTPSQQQQQQQQQQVVMKNRASHTIIRAESPLKYTSGPNGVKEEPCSEFPKGKNDFLNLEQVGPPPSINSPMPVRPRYSRVYSGSSLRNTSSPISESSGNDNNLILQRPYTENVNEIRRSKQVDVQRNFSANPIPVSNNENNRKDFELTLPEKDIQVETPGVATAKRNSSGVYSLLNTVLEKNASSSLEASNNPSEPVQKKKKF